MHLFIVSAFNSLLSLITSAIVASSSWSVNIPFNFGTLNECDDRDFLYQYFPLEVGCANSYRLCLAFYAVIVISLSLLELKEQAYIKFLLGILRFSLLGSIIIYCLYSILFFYDHEFDEITTCANSDNQNVTVDEFNSSEATVLDVIVHFDIKGWVLGIPVMFFACAAHSSIPTLVHPIREKKWLKWCLVLLYITVGTSYLVISTLGAVWFREVINETFTLNWVRHVIIGNILIVIC